VTDPTLPELIRAATAATEHAYVPYSHYPVGSALLAADGTVYTGCNVENAAYPSSICAERVALVKAVSDGQREFKTVIVATRDGGSPCGTCRQMLFEFSPDMWVVMARFDGEIVAQGTLREFLLHGFGPSHLLPTGP
jgi:cytidine deaminase